MIKGVLFDKDGTLVDFFGLWVAAAQAVIPAFMKGNKISECEEMKKYLLETIGIKQGSVDPQGAIAFKSYGEIAADISEALTAKGVDIPCENVEKQIVYLFEKYISGNEIDWKPLFPLEKLFKDLRNQGIRIGLATADTFVSARNCLTALGIEQYFDYIGADDGTLPPKPAPDMLLDFARQSGIYPEEVAVVGDTYNDILFAAQCSSVGVGVLTGVSKESDYYGEADYILESAADVGILCSQVNRRSYYGTVSA